jgi:hypothetical protein
MSKTGDINEIMHKYLSPILMEQIQTKPVDSFKEFYRSAKECLKQIKDENRSRFLKIFEEVFQAFLERQLNDKHYSGRLTESPLKQLLNIALELSSTSNLQHPSFLLIIRHLLFKLNKNIVFKSAKIESLFARLNNFDQQWCATTDPANIIRDEWLTDYIFLIPQEWLKVSKDQYQNLCDLHHNNRWSVYIWSRIVHLSFIKSEIIKPNEILMPLNEWMNNVEHNIYNNNDILTIIFVKNIFEIIIARHMKSVLSLSNVDLILQYIALIRKETPNLIDTKLVDDFVENIKQSIKDVLSLNGKTSY